MNTKTKLFGIEVDKVSIEKQTIDSIEIVADLYYDPLKSGDNYIYRYCLDINLINSSNENKEITVILFNPSEYNLSKRNKNIFIDKTITNVIKIINDDNRFSKIRILNLFPTINSNTKDIMNTLVKYTFPCEKKTEKIMCQNIDTIKSVKNSTILLAWGQIGNGIKAVKDYKSEIYKALLKNKNSLLTFCPAKNNYPKHPGRLDFECCRNCFGRNGKIKLIKFCEK